MLITDDGRWEGAIGGGCLEGDAQGPGLPADSRFVLTERASTSIPDWLWPTIAGVMASRKPHLSCYIVASGQVGVLVERLDSGIDLVIFGVGYDTIPLVRLATAI